MGRSPKSRCRTIFVTGTDTGVGKTLLTALLLQQLRESGCHALAMKPFCSGGLADVKLLQSLQPGELADREMNPYYFEEPVAPLVARESRRKPIRLSEVVACIRLVEARCETLIIEGSGGLMVPLGQDFMIVDLIGQIDCEVVVVAPNRLGTINHTMLTVSALQAIGREQLTVVLMSQPKPDYSARTNQILIENLLKPVDVLGVPFLGNDPLGRSGSKKYREILKKHLAKLAVPV